MGQSAGSIFLSLRLNNAAQFQNSVSSAASGAGSAAGSTFSKLFNAAILAAIPIGIVAAIKKAMTSSAVELASDLQETQNVVNKAFGSMKQDAEDFAKSAMESYGLTELQAKQYSSTYMSMASAMGLAEETAAKMSINLTKLSADVASFYNLSNDESFNKFKGVFSGETEPLKALGIVMTQTNLEAFALKNGIEKSYKAMSEGEKVALRYKFIMEQLKLAQGDFAETADGWANSMKTLGNKWDAFMTKIGNGLVKIFAPVLRFLLACVDKLHELIDLFYEKIGWDFSEEEVELPEIELPKISDEAEEDANKIAESYENAADKAKEALEGLASFDQINTLTGGSSDKGSSDSSSDYDDDGGEFSFNPFGDEYLTEIKVKENEMKPVVDGIVERLQEIWDTYGTKAVAIIEDVYDFFKPYGERMGGIVKTLKETFDEWWATNGDEFKKNLGECWKVIKDIVTLLLDTLFNWLETSGPKILVQIMDFIAFLAKIGPYILETVKGILWGLEYMALFVVDIIAYTLGAIPEFIEALSETLAAIVTTFAAMGMAIWKTFMWVMTDLPAIAANTLVEFVTDVGNAFVAIGQYVTQFFVDLIALLTAFFEGLYEKIRIVFEVISRVCAGIAIGIYDLCTTVWDAFMWIMTDLPSIVANALVTAVQYVTQFFANVVTDVGNAFAAIGQFFVDLWDGICSFFDNAGQAVQDFWNGFLEAAKAPINGIISLINMMIDGLNTIQFDIPDWLGGGKFGINIAHIPMLAEGGVITAPTLAMVGEGSQNEAVVPLDDFKRDIAAIVASAVANTMAQMVNNDNNNGNTEIIVNVGGEKLYDNIVKNINRRSRNNGKCVINT